jgi:hypothetical protein
MRARISAILLLSLFFSMLSETAFAAVDDATVSATEQMSAAMEFVSGRGLLTPQEDGMLHPERYLTRIDLMHAIVRDVYGGENRGACFDNIAPSLPARFTLLFTDVRRTDAYATDVCIGMFTGIVSGRPDGSFRPFAGTNFAESSKIITKAYGIAPFMGLRPNTNVPWHEPYWYALARRQAIPETVTARSQTLTRGEFAEILYRLRSERPTLGFRYGATFAQVDADAPIVAVEDSMIGHADVSIDGDGMTAQQRDRLALAKRAEMRVVSSLTKEESVRQNAHSLKEFIKSDAQAETRTLTVTFVAHAGTDG